MCCCRIRSSLSAALSNVRMLHFPPNYSRIQYWPLQQIPLMWTYQFLNIKTKYWLRISTYWTGSDYSGTKCCSSHPSLSTVLQSDTRAARSLPRGLYRAPSATLWLRGSLRCAWAGPCRWGSAAGHCCSPCGPLLGQGCLRRPLGCTCWSCLGGPPAEGPGGVQVLLSEASGTWTRASPWAWPWGRAAAGCCCTTEGCGDKHMLLFVYSQSSNMMHDGAEPIGQIREKKKIIITLSPLHCYIWALLELHLCFYFSNYCCTGHYRACAECFRHLQAFSWTID